MEREGSTAANRPPGSPAGQSAPRSRARRWLRRLVVGVCTVLVAVVAAELYLRSSTESWLGPVVQQRWLLTHGADGYLRPAPGFEGEITWGGTTTHVRTNSVGIRGAELAPARDGELRVLAVGDSMVFGFGCELDDTFTHRMEPLLAEQTGRSVVARIGAAPSLGTADLPGVVDGLRPEFHPSVVLVGVALANDLTDIFEPTRKVIDGYLLFGPLARAADQSLRIRAALHSRVCFVIEHFLRTRVPSLAVSLPDGSPEAAAFVDFPAARTGAVFMDREPATPAIERILDRFDSALARVAAAAAGTDAIVIVLPTLRHCDPEQYRQFVAEQGWNVDEFRRGALQERLIARCERHGLDAVDLTAVLSAHENPDALFLDDDTHFSPAGHRVVAEHLADVLAQR